MAWIVLLALLLAGCTSADTSSPSPPASPGAATGPSVADGRAGGTLRIGLGLDPASIDPRFVADDEGELVVSALFEPLVTLDDRLQVQPAAAERFEVTDEGRRLVFYLREAEFHDGTPVTADDFVRTFSRILDGTADPPSYLGYLLEPIAGATQAQQHGGEVAGLRALDERTLEIALDVARPAFLRTLADPSLVPVPAWADDDLGAFAAQPVGNGPFTMNEPREPGQFLRLTRNPAHHAAPLLDEVVLSIYPGSTPRDQQWDDLLAGHLHVAQVPSERIAEARETYGESPDGYTGPGLLDGVTSTVYLYGFDLDRAPFDDVRVRRALSLSVDRERLARQVLAGSRVAAFGVVPPSVPGSQARACAYCRHDPQQARILWQQVAADLRAEEPPVEDGAEADAEGADADVDAEAGTDVDADAVEAGADADEAGADADDEPAPDLADPTATAPDDASDPDADAEEAPAVDEWPEALQRITLTHNRGRTHSAIADRMAADIEAALGITVDLEALDLGAFVQRVNEREAGMFRIGWESGDPDPGAYLVPLFHSREVGRDNLTGYADERVDALLDEAATLEQDAAARARWREAERLLLTDMPVMPLLWYRQSRVVAPEVSGLRWAPFGRIDLTRVELTAG